MMLSYGRSMTYIWTIIVAVICTPASSLLTGRDCCLGEYDLITEDFRCVSNGIKIDLSCPKRELLAGEPEFFIQGSNLLLADGLADMETYCTGRRMSDVKPVAIYCHPSEDNVDTYLMTSVITKFISAGFLLLTFIIYVWIPELRTVQGKCIMFYLLNLIFWMMGIAILEDQKQDQDVSPLLCVVESFGIIFNLISAIAWLNIIAFDVSKSILFEKDKKKEKVLFMMYNLWVFTVPFWNVLSNIIHFVKKDMELTYIVRRIFEGRVERNLSHPRATEYLPFIITVCLLGIIIIRGLTDKSKQTTKVRWKLVTVFIFLSQFWHTSSYYIVQGNDWTSVLILGILNVSYAISTLFILVFLRTAALKGLAHKKVFFISWPEKWKNLKDDGAETEEVKLSPRVLQNANNEEV